MNQPDLIRHFRATKDRYQRMVWSLHHLRNRHKFFFQQQSRHARDTQRNRMRTSMRSMYHPKPILHEIFRTSRLDNRPRKCQVICLFLGVKAQIFQYRNTPAPRIAHHLTHFVTHAVINKSHRSSQHIREMRRYRCETVFLLSSIWPPKVTDNDDFTILLDQIAECGQ